MSQPEVFPLAQVPVTSHAFNADRSGKFAHRLSVPFLTSFTEVAVSLNSSDVQIYARQGNDWKPTEVLSEVRANMYIASYHLADKSNAA